MADNEFLMAESGQKNVVKLKYTTNESSFVISDGRNNEDISLQEAFKRYREAKQDELRQARLLRKRQELRKADPQKMAALRQKFVNQAKKYYGYPYARKYWPPDSPEYNSKLFLDCCGLVRRVMRDLADDFGFIIGPWNQAYMYDTLPITVENEKDMKPGDLVFISATYYNPKSRKQRHNMTHVEIWAGEGCKTIGARWNNGKVQLWDSYKFIAKSYHSETYIFKSIDTWLKGICTSFCAQHFWKRSKYSPSKKSIFALPEQIEEDQAAGDDDDNVDSFTVRGNTFCNQVTSVSKMLMQCKVSELPRPKTEHDLPNLRVDSPSSNVKQMGSQVDFPTIRNDLKERSKTSFGKKKKAKGGGDVKRKVKSSKSSEKLKKESKLEKSSIIAWSATSNAPDGDKEIPEDHNKELGQFSISGSLNDLGRKGLYLRDLMETQKVGAANGSGDELDGGEEIQGNGDKDDDNQIVDSEDDDDDDDDAIGYDDDDDDEEDDDDDEYFVFAKEENSDDDDKQNEKMMNRNVDGNVSDDSSQFIMGEDIDSADEKETENIKTDKCHIGDELDSELTDKSREVNPMSNLGVTNETGNVSEDRKENTVDDRVDKKIDTITKDHEFDKMTGYHSNAVNNIEGKGLEKKITMIDNIMPFASDRESRALIHCNLNENAISKTNEKPPTNKHDKARGQCLKASIVTLVSQAGPCGSQPSSSPAQVLPSESGTSHSSSTYTQSTGSQGSLATEDVTRITKSRCSLAAVDHDVTKSSSGAR